MASASETPRKDPEISAGRGSGLVTTPQLEGRPRRARAHRPRSARRLQRPGLGTWRLAGVEAASMDKEGKREKRRSYLSSPLSPCSRCSRSVPVLFPVPGAAADRLKTRMDACFLALQACPVPGVPGRKCSRAGFVCCLGSISRAAAGFSAASRSAGQSGTLGCGLAARLLQAGVVPAGNRPSAAPCLVWCPGVPGCRAKDEPPPPPPGTGKLSASRPYARTHPRRCAFKAWLEGQRPAQGRAKRAGSGACYVPALRAGSVKTAAPLRSRSR
jgi:hypothetical protein